MTVKGNKDNSEHLYPSTSDRSRAAPWHSRDSAPAYLLVHGGAGGAGGATGRRRRRRVVAISAIR